MKFIYLLMLFALAACSENEVPVPAQPPVVSIMTFNVENLFDNSDDPGKDDMTYLPLADKQNPEHIAECEKIEVDRWREECLHLDWNDAVIDAKLHAIAATIRQLDGGADIIALQEVENAAILNRLVDEYLGDLGYGPAILIEGQDVRGIDVAFLTKLPVIDTPKLHPLQFPEHPEREGDTRGVLETTFALPDGAKLTGFAVHFPAPFHPTDMRVAAYRHLAALRNALPDDHHVFAAGDFNTTSSEAEKTGLLERQAGPIWRIAHQDALAADCSPCDGTQYYARDDSWSFLDMILWAPARGENTTWQIRANSVRVLNENPEQVNPDGTPNRFDTRSRTGVSDHWPLLAVIEPIIKQ